MSEERTRTYRGGRAYHLSRKPAAPASGEVARADFETHAADAWRGGGIGRNFHPMRTVVPFGKVEAAVLARWASLKYTRPPGLPKQKLFARLCGASFAQN